MALSPAAGLIAAAPGKARGQSLSPRLPAAMSNHSQLDAVQRSIQHLVAPLNLPALRSITFKSLPELLKRPFTTGAHFQKLQGGF